MLCRIVLKDSFRQIHVDPLHDYVFDEYAVGDLFLEFGWRSNRGYWNLVASSLEHAHNQTSFHVTVVSEHGRNDVAHVSVDAICWETMSTPQDCERVPSAGVAAGSPGADREMMPIPPDCERVPGSGITTGVTHASWETLSIPPDRTHIPDCERVPGNDGDAGDPFFVWFYVDGGILVKVRFFQDGRRLRRAIESLASDHF